MQSSAHTLNELFDQLGLPSGDQDIDRFIERHKPVGATRALSDMDFFTEAQKQFLRDATKNDADWMDATGKLGDLLRQPPDVRPS